MRKNIQNFPSKILTEFDRFLKLNTIQKKQTISSLPKFKQNSYQLTKKEIKHTRGLMRINHTGEICAQALYYGQALLAKDKKTQQHLLQAADEEFNHLCWCQERLDDLNTHTSSLNFIWYINSFMLGATAALFGDKISYGFVMEVEKQVENHLQEHITQISPEDTKTQAILQQMQADEIRHGENAKQAGGKELAKPIKSIMTGMSKFMKYIVYRI